MPKFDDYWFDEYGGRPPHEDGHHGEPHDYPYDDYPHDHHPHPHPPFDGRRHRPVDMGKVDTTKMHDRYDMFVPHHMPPWGFKFPKLEKAFVPGSTPQEQVAYLLNRVDTMIDYFNHYDDKVWGAYNAVVHSALGNEAYYREITREEGYLADGSTPYTVIHIPYLDRADRPIFLELGLAYNNTTNNGVKENVFEASQNRLADKLIPAFNIADGWEGKAMLKGAPIQSTYTEGKFTLAVTDNGFLKIYPNTVSYDQLNRDRIRNAMGVQGVLINNGAKTPEQYATNGGELLARVGIGMNYETKERLIVIVNGNPTPPNDASVTGATADMFADIFARYNCTVAVETANNGSAVGMDKGQMIYMPDTATTGVIPTVPSINCYWYITKRRHYHNQYVKDVADLIQKVGQNKWRCEIALQSCDFLKGRVNDLQRDLDAEVQARQDADEQLQNNIDAEAEARRLADEQLQDNIDAEAETRRLADVQLQDNIDAETNARVAGDNALDERITNEVSILNTRIDTVVEDFNNAIATERQARIDGDTALGTRIDNEVATINARIDTEVATLNALIDAEEQARIAGDTALQNSLTQLREDYTAFLATYASDLAETRRITTALRNDITTIQGQIAELQSNMSAVNASITAILATINSVEQSFENIKTAFTGIQNEWHDYKEDIDVEIAQLTQDIGDLNSQTHDTVADMKSDTNLKTGMYVRTGGYYAVNDGGGALYRINNTVPNSYYESLQNGLYAQLVNDSVVSVKQFGATGDGVTDDTAKIQAAVDNAKNIFFPAGEYIITNCVFVGSDTTLWGTGKESKIINTVVTGYTKNCIMTGVFDVGTGDTSYLNIQTYVGTVASDRHGLTMSDTSDFSVGDLIYICKDETYTTKNPPNSWVAKVTDVMANTSITIDSYIDNDELIDVNCLVRNLKHLSESRYYNNNIKHSAYISENVCIHDLSIIQREDSGSGMYTLSIGTYRGYFYNLWTKGNTAIGSNFSVYCVYESIHSMFDGSFADIPEVNQYAVIRNCDGYRYGSRLITLGISLLQGYKCLIEGCHFDFGNDGRVGVLSHIKPTIRNNTFLNLYTTSGIMHLSNFGQSIFKNNVVSSKVGSNYLAIAGSGNVITGNYLDNPNCPRWYNFATLDLSTNKIKDNETTNQTLSDTYFNLLPQSGIATNVDNVTMNTRNVAVGNTYDVFSNVVGVDHVGYPAIWKFRFAISAKTNFNLIVTLTSGTTRTIAITDTDLIEMIFARNTNYWLLIKDGSVAQRFTQNEAVDVSKISVENTSDAEFAVVYSQIETVKV